VFWQGTVEEEPPLAGYELVEVAFEQAEVVSQVDVSW
jgi:hypothetical protein